MNKKFLSCLVLCLFTFCLPVVSAYGASAQLNQSDSKFFPPEADFTMNVTLAGGSAGGAFSTIAEGLGEAVRRTYKKAQYTMVPGSDAPNLDLIDKGQLEFGFVHTGMAKTAIEGTEPFTQAMPNTRAVCVIIPASGYVTHIIATAKSGITSLKEVVDQKKPIRICVNKKDSFMEVCASAALEAYGVTYEDIISWGGQVVFNSTGDGLELMKDDMLDCLFTVTQYPTANITEAAAATRLVMVSLDQQAMDYVAKKLAMIPSSVPAGSYSFVTQNIPSLGVPVIITTSTTVSPQIVYALVNSLAEQLEYMGTVHSSLKGLTLKGLTDVGGIQLHEGAQKFFEEKGLF